MADNQRTVGGGAGRGRQTDPAELAPTQVSGGAAPDYSSSKTLPSEGAPAWPPPDRSPFRPFPEPSREPPEMAGSETVVMEIEPQAPIPLAWLAVLEGPGGARGKLVTLKTETVVGRSQGDLTLNGDRAVSSQHVKVRLEPKESGAEGEPHASEGRQVFVLYDLASRNGTYVGTRETYRDDASRVYRRELHDGDYLLLGETTLVFKQVDE